MQLKKIKLAGFKSFVDPTTVLLPSQLIAIVGPNGCGKSNIIDAVCWVMGESSAKYLRGELLTDVIFNGSSARKPIGQASVELVFDNQDGSLGGEYASYAEISIRRQISRDSESAYFLNGTRCRRRDIIDIFLGTGLGPRSYSIIGQNMISRVIEAKPEEMRVYIEEAAGISRYKERRRETENRILHARENLSRLNDLQAELEKQLSSLKRQANAAERFKGLKQEERILRAQWLAIQWRDLDARLVHESLQIQQQATGLEARQADLSELNLQLEYKREAQQAAIDAFQGVQRRFYSIGNDIARLEQNIQHHTERQQRWQADLQQVTQDSLNAEQTIEETQAEQEELTKEADALAPALQKANTTVQETLADLALAEQSLQEWQAQLDSFNQVAAKTTQTIQVEATRIQHLEQKISSIQKQQTRRAEESVQWDFDHLDQQDVSLQDRVSFLETQKTTHEDNLKHCREKIVTVQKAQKGHSDKLDLLRKELQILLGQQASLSALQETALGQRNNQSKTWLQKYQLDKKLRLAQNMSVAPGWELAVEKVLGTYLQAICLDDMTDVAAWIEQFEAGNVSIVSKNNIEGAHVPNTYTTLLSKIQSNSALAPLLAGIYVAESEADAWNMRAHLTLHESVIVRNGLWIGPSWLHLSRNDGPEVGIFQREQELQHLAHKIETCQLELRQLETQLATDAEELKALEGDYDQLQKKSHQVQMQYAEAQGQQKIARERYTELKKRAEQFEKEESESIAQLKQAELDLASARFSKEEATAQLAEQALQRNTYMHEREALREKVMRLRNEVNQVRTNAHQIEIRLQTTKSQCASLSQTLMRLKAQQAAFEERKAVLLTEMGEEAESALQTLQEELSTALTARLTVEEELTNVRKNRETIDQEIHTIDTDRQTVERDIAKFRDFLEHLRVECQGVKVKIESLLEQINETGLQLADILKELPQDAVADEWHARLEQLAQRIARLGAINLVAIEEYAACSERKEYLDRQCSDLVEGLTTLENAIAKIDKETRNRFKETFDKVNDHFQTLFPKIFGGGHASLELTGDNLLDTGIMVMACPPGKRNSSIHLLSGGEKALTAISLVFSIFQLSPSPFCLLDEVDAPLDDANVARFCRLVHSMAEKTQFIFISHNKLAIEMAETLIGVTMHEPGVSRLVSVDVTEAMSLASK